ncbi:hypothetical protein Tco_0743511 [Tanacetum coccineum]
MVTSIGLGTNSQTSFDINWFSSSCIAITQHVMELEENLATSAFHSGFHLEKDRVGLTLYSHVGDVIRDGDWVWPRVLLDKYQFLNECTVPLSNNCDTLEWRLYDGTVKRFSVAQVWECIRPRANKDRVSIWDYSNVLGSTCPLCEATPDSHEHLFFSCPFANSVWSRMKVKAGLGRVSHNIYDIVDHFGGIARRKTTHVVIAKLVVAASAYFIWQERNWRLFKKSKRSIDQVVSCISSSVRMKLLSCAFKRTTEGVLYASLVFKPSADSETSTISLAKIKHHGMSLWIPLDSSSRIMEIVKIKHHGMSNWISFDSSSRIKANRSSGHKTELVLRHRSLSSQPSLDHSLPKLHGVTEKLDTPIVAVNLRIAFVFQDWDDFIKSPFFRHLRASEDLVKKAS